MRNPPPNFTLEDGGEGDIVAGMDAERMRALRGDPVALERAYRDDPDGFARVFPAVLAHEPNDPVWRTWQARLSHAAPATAPPRSHGRPIALTIGLALLAGTLVKLPVWLPFLNEQLYYARNSVAIVIFALAAYFLASRPDGRTVLRVLIPLAAIGLLFLNLLPDRPKSDTIVMSMLHMPLFFWSLLGVAFMGAGWRLPARRMDFLRYNGELVIHTAIILLGGIVLSGLTMALFDLIKVRIEDWYLRNVVVYGVVGAPLVATLMVDRLVGERLKLAPLVARIFSPLFLVMVTAYLVVVAVQQKSPYTDREFLIAFNGLLLVVLGLSILVIAERRPGARAGFFDYVTIGLVLVTLAIDVIALSAIVFRLHSYGFTPNRITVLGANLIAFVHLVGILANYARMLWRRAGDAALETWIARYLPAYTAWSLFVAVALPLLFRFR
jgi:hypothetical protein